MITLQNLNVNTWFKSR